jgi:hydrogenase maturation protein HypF
MARDMSVIRRYCWVTAEEEQQLLSSQAPIVLMRANGAEKLPAAVAPGLDTYGFMLPSTPLHVLIMRHFDRPLVMTSGNVSGEPQITDDDEALERFQGIADYALVHNRPIAVRVDDSVVRVIGAAARVWRRARGYAPAPLFLPKGFEKAPPVLAMGADLKSTFCLTNGGEAVLSHHQGDLDDCRTFDSYCESLAFYSRCFAHSPHTIACDLHPEYASSRHGRAFARQQGLPVIELQHHHAHIAACLAENGQPLNSAPVLGIALDGLGWGDDGTPWGGEFILADYRRAKRLACLKPAPLLGGDRAALEPWRNLYAQLVVGPGWPEFSRRFAALQIREFLDRKPLAVLDAMVRNKMLSPESSSCGRLFDAVAAALGICAERQEYEGEAASQLESIAADCDGDRHGEEYPFAVLPAPDGGLLYLDPLPMWQALFADLSLALPIGVISRRFHFGMAGAIARLAKRLAFDRRQKPLFQAVALSGGCLQNAILLTEVERRLHAEGFSVFSHSAVPANDGGLALGQAAIASARLLDSSQHGEWN